MRKGPRQPLPRNTMLVRKKQMLNRTQKRQVRSIVNSNLEKKYFDTLLSGTVSTTAQISKLTTIPTGTTDSTRVGDKVKMLSLNLRFLFGAADATNVCRFIIFQWHLNDGTAPVVTDILNNTGVTDVFMAYYNHDQGKNFTVLCDKMIISCLNASNANVWFKWRHSFNRKRKLSDKFVKNTIKFIAAANTGMDHIYMLIVSDSSALTHPGYNLDSRVTYTDA